MTLCGYYLVRLRPHGPLMPARIWEACERDQDGKPMSDVLLSAEVAGRPWPVFDCYIRHRVWANDYILAADHDGVSELLDCRGCELCETQGPELTTAPWPGRGFILKRGVYPKCLKHPITEADYRYLIDDTNWCNEWEPTDPKATPWLTQGQIKRTLEVRRKIYERMKEAT